jgi:hypothetical protein
MADVWRVNWFGSTKTLDVHVASLRAKLAAAARGSGGGPEQYRGGTRVPAGKA